VPSWFAERVRAPARQGEALLDRTLGRSETLGMQLKELVRVLLLPRNRRLGDKKPSSAIPSLLNVVIPGFDDDAEEQQPDVRPPGTLLLLINIRAPLLAGVAVSRPDLGGWVEPLLAVPDRPTRPRIWDCLSSLRGKGR
jgi:hypothetical protein